MARQLGAYLKLALNFLDKFPHAPSPDEIKHALDMIELLHKTIRHELMIAQQMWSTFPHPAEVARRDMTKGRELLKPLNDSGAVLVTANPAGEIVFTMEPSVKLQALSGFEWHRFDWPLGTSDVNAATDAAAYILTAVTYLEDVDLHLPINKRWSGAYGLMALYEYLTYARPDKGVGLGYLPSWLPQSLTALNLHIGINTKRTPLRILDTIRLIQQPSSVFTLTQEQIRPGPLKERRFEIPLETTSPIVAYLLYMRLVQRLDAILLRVVVY